MKTEMRLVNGKTVIVNGSPQDFMQMVQGIGVSQNKTMTCIKGEEFKFEDVMTMQQVNK